GFLAAEVRADDPRARDVRAVVVDLGRVAGGGEASAALVPGAEAAVLAIDLGTRRRYRMNGRLEALDAARLRLRVREAFPNCPKYVQKRRLLAVAPRKESRPPRGGAGALPD